MDAHETRSQLKQISASFCPLRWTYLQVDLEHGRVKACCKTPFVRVQAEEIWRNDEKAIFNGPYFQNRRREMLEGVWHSDCDSCWTQERLDLLSYRYSECAKEPHRSAIIEVGGARRVDGARPKHIEFILSTLCDLKCTYCGPEFSTAWAADLKTHGPFSVLPAPDDLAAACEGFRETFWRWFDEVRHDVEYIQFNGGEPLLQNEFYSTLDRVADSCPPPQLGVISNLNTPPPSLARFRRVLPALLERHAFRLGISQDSVGSRAEYIRYGLIWKRFDENLRGLLAEFPALEVQIAPTMSALNITSIHALLVYLDELVAMHGPRIILRPSIVMSPDFLSPFALPPQYCRYLDEAIVYLDQIGRWPEMKARLQEIRYAMERSVPSLSIRSNLMQWIQSHDLRRRTRFLDTFPELHGLVGT